MFVRNWIKEASWQTEFTEKSFMFTHTVTAQSHPNIAFIKYWGNRDPILCVSANGSILMNLDGLETRTTVTFDASLAQGQLVMNGQPVSEGDRLWTLHPIKILFVDSTKKL
jgi:mevalonate pyrophosphate decarboxylase